MDNRITIVHELRNILGESPIWDARTGLLYWADLLAQTIYCLNVHTGANQQWLLPETLGSLALTADPHRLLVAMRSGIYFFKTQSEDLTRFVVPKGEPRAMNRFNDGKVAPDGRFFVGTMDEHTRDKRGRLYRIEPDGTADLVKEGFVISNGLAWNHSGDVLYHSCSESGKIWSYDYDMETGSLTNERIFAEVPINLGKPDGAACSVDGCYWSAGVFGGNLLRYNCDGQIVEQIKLPSKGVTMPCFGGQDMQTIYVTSLTQDFSQEDFNAYPHSGYLLAVKVDVKGVVIPPFGMKSNFKPSLM